jgi:hypothetical protein
MHNYLARLCFMVVLGSAVAGAAGCDDNKPGASGAAGSGGSTGGSSGSGGVGAGAAGAAGGAGAGAPGAGGDGNATGTGGDVAQTPEEIHDGLINARTTGGVAVTRTPPTVSYPTCQ